MACRGCTLWGTAPSPWWCAVIYLPPNPAYDQALAEWILERRARLGHDRAFYNSAAWRRLRAKVLAEFHGESQWELGRSPALYVPCLVW